jgi:hypothetical protein
MGVIFCLIPGPGLPLLFFGAAILSERSRPVARALDWTELRTRTAVAYARRYWKRASMSQKVAIVTLAALALLGAGFGAYAATIGR